MPERSRDGLNIAAAHEAIAEAVPDRECIVWRERRLSWHQVTDRTRRFANGLTGIGIGGTVRETAHGWESPHDHVALLLTNGNEYLEAMLGCWKARAASVNVNYRYTADEVRYVLLDSSAAAVVYHRRFAPIVADALATVDIVPALIVVDDDSTAAPVPGSLDYEELLAGASDARPSLQWPGTDRYLVYTGGTTGAPKGVLWHQDDFLASALGITSSLSELVERARRPDRPRALPAPPFMHGAAHWNAISCWLAGGTVLIQDDVDRLDAADVLDTCAAERATSLLIVGDAFARPLVDELERSPRPLHHLRALMTGGAILSPSLRRRLLERLPELQVVDILGSSETGRHGVSASDRRADAASGVFTPSATTVVLDDDRQHPLERGAGAAGWLAQRGRVPLGYLGDRARTEATFPRIDGVVHAVAGDRARVLADGRIELLGREAGTINTGGEKVHAEEVEKALKNHPDVYDALVVGRSSERWGQEVVAVVAPIDGRALDPAALTDCAAASLARYKLPKDYVEVPEIRRSASGKPDYGWARRIVAGSEI